jgi:sucrose-6-phosphate hydrolase SacC (GH32 family)
VFQMWYGAQGKDGHDRILFAQSKDGTRWERRGVAVEDATANHVNDPSVVKAKGVYFMYFTRAGKGVVDEVAHATSEDGVTWRTKGPVLSPGKAGEWDALSVGRPSVVFEDGLFRMWYDGRKDLPAGAPAEGVPKAPTSTRSVGYATSEDGVHWTKHEKNPVFGHDAGGVDVAKLGEKKFLMVYESRDGTRLATSGDGLTWRDHGLWVERSGGPTDAFGHVTPHLRVWPGQRLATLYFGAASAATWDHNVIAASAVPYEEIEALLAEEEN